MYLKNLFRAFVSSWFQSYRLTLTNLTPYCTDPPDVSPTRIVKVPSIAFPR